MNKPTKVRILGKNYKIVYCNSPVDVDLDKVEGLWGIVDPWKKTIRLYDNPDEENMLSILLHEVLHAIEYELKLKCFDEDEGHAELDLVALGLADFLIRNNYMKESTDEDSVYNPTPHTGREGVKGNKCDTGRFRYGSKCP